MDEPEWLPDDRATLAPAHVRWEYRTQWLSTVRPNMDVREALDADLNALGADGWELTGVVGGSTGVRCFFKRPRPDVST